MILAHGRLRQEGVNVGLTYATRQDLFIKKRIKIKGEEVAHWLRSLAALPGKLALIASTPWWLMTNYNSSSRGSHT